MTLRNTIWSWLTAPFGGREESTELQVREASECDHDYTEWDSTQEPMPVFTSVDSDIQIPPIEPRVMEGHLVFDTVVRQYRKCEKCGNFDHRTELDETHAVEIATTADSTVPLGELRGAIESDEDETRRIINEQEQ